MALIIVISISLLVVVAVVIWYVTSSDNNNNNNNEEVVVVEELNAEEMLELSISTEPMTANLKTHEYIVISFDILLDSEEAKAEFEKRMSQVRNINIMVLATMTPQDLIGNDELQDILKEEYNQILQDGEVVRVLTIDRQIQ